MSFSTIYQIPDEFRQILDGIKTNSDTNRALQQITLQSLIGQKLLIVLVQ